MKKRIILIMTFLFASVILTGCTIATPSSLRKQIVTTLYPEYDMIQKIIGTDNETQGLFDVTMIIKPGQDSHTYDPSIKDLITMKNADVFIYTSDELETWVGRIGFTKKTKVIDLSKTSGITLVKAEDHDDDDSHSHDHTHVHSYDPHYWIYPIYASRMVNKIKDVLCDNIDDPYNTIKRVLEKNANNYIEELLAIDNNLKMISELAKNRTMYFGSPFAFYYLSYFYDLDYELLYNTCSIEGEPSLTALVNIISKMKENDIDVIFSKELVNTSGCDVIAFHTGATILELHSCHNVSIDDFKNPDVSFISIMKQNVINLAKMLKVDQEVIDVLVKEEAK